jgi:hypothetical protein
MSIACALIIVNFGGVTRCCDGFGCVRLRLVIELIFTFLPRELTKCTTYRYFSSITKYMEMLIPIGWPANRISVQLIPQLVECPLACLGSFESNIFLEQLTQSLRNPELIPGTTSHVLAT